MLLFIMAGQEFGTSAAGDSIWQTKYALLLKTYENKYALLVSHFVLCTAASINKVNMALSTCASHTGS